MNHYGEEFLPERVEEQIERYQTEPAHSSASAHLLHDLQRLADEDRQRLAKIRARLVAHASMQEQQPLPFQRPHRTSALPAPHTNIRNSRKGSPYLVTLLSGLVALLIIGSMFGVLNLFKPGDRQAQVQHTPVVVATPHAMPDIHGLAAFVIDAHSGNTLVDVNRYTRLPIGGTARIMTAVVAIENANVDQMVTIDQNTLNEIPPGLATAGLQAGDQLSLRDLLSALLLPSGRDAAFVIAYAVAGNTQNFVTLMNDEAHQLQLTDTHFSDPYGSSSEDNYSTAADLTHLASYALQLSAFAQTVAEQRHVLPATFQHHSYEWTNTNPLLSIYAGMNGIEISYDPTAGACMVFSAERNGRLLIGVELHAPSQKVLISDVKSLLNHAFVG